MRVADGVHYPGTHFVGGYNRPSTQVTAPTVENESLVNVSKLAGIQANSAGQHPRFRAGEGTR